MGDERSDASTVPGLASADSFCGRCGAAAVLSAAVTGLSSGGEPGRIRAAFEEGVRTLLSARSVAVREDPGEYLVPGPNTISLDLPSAVPERRSRLEAVFDAAWRMDMWARHVLDASAQVAALLLELERVQRLVPVRRPRDGAAPLIGSSPAIQRVRERIERVAATDFTILIEGASGPQPHPSFIDVFGEAAGDDGDGAVAGAGHGEGPAVKKMPSSLGNDLAQRGGGSHFSSDEPSER